MKIAIGLYPHVENELIESVEPSDPIAVTRAKKNACEIIQCIKADDAYNGIPYRNGRDMK